MKELDTVLASRKYEHELIYDKNFAVIFQPESFAYFGMHAEFHEAFERYARLDAYRGLDVVRVWSFILNAKYVLSRTGGSLAELGVYRGQSASVLSLLAKNFERKMYILDTFDGFAESQLEQGMSEAAIGAFQDTSLEEAKRVVGDYIGNRWVVGTFPESITDEMRSDNYSVVSIDCDIYQPISDGLNFFWPRLVEGGIIFVHDYSTGHWVGATKAVDEFCEANRIRPVLISDLGGSCILAKGSR